MAGFPRKSISLCLLFILFIFLNFCATKSVLAAYHEAACAHDDADHSTTESAHSNHSGSEKDKEGEGEKGDSFCCSKIVATQNSPVITKGPALQIAYNGVLPHTLQSLGSLLNPKEFHTFDFLSDRSPPAFYRSTYSNHAPPIFS